MIKFENLTLRYAEENDAAILTKWWNDGSVMAHAGFPNGLNISEEKVIKQISEESEETIRRLVIEYDDVPVGEMSYRNLGNGSAEIGIKICEKEYQNKFNGRKYLSMLINMLFEKGYQKIVLDTNLNNKRAQHVYELIGFKKVKVNHNSWTNQLGKLQSSVDYQLIKEDFIDYTKAKHMEEIKTEDLILRSFQLKDLEDLYEYLSDEEVVKFEPYKPMNREEALIELRERIYGDVSIAVEEKATGKVIGNVYFAPIENNQYELGYVFNRKYWGKGYAYQACKAVCDKAFNNGCLKIMAYCDPLNPNSWKLLERLGFTREQYIEKDIWFFKDEQGNPIWKDTYVYGLENKGEH